MEIKLQATIVSLTSSPDPYIFPLSAGQKMGNLSVSTMEMGRHPYDTIDKASVQNFYDEIRPKVSNTTCPADQPSQRARVTVVGGEPVAMEI